MTEKNQLRVLRLAERFVNWLTGGDYRCMLYYPDERYILEVTQFDFPVKEWSTCTARIVDRTAPVGSRVIRSFHAASVRYVFGEFLRLHHNDMLDELITEVEKL